jgi:LAS superfamily LD-carboxypeptidase LdcB
MSLIVEERLLVGRAPELMVSLEAGGVSVHRDVVAALRALAAAAARDGIALEVASGYRGFERQLAIWNEKARGERPLLDAAEHTLQPGDLSPEQRVFAILRWSALPGASRHHWGTDVDVFDRAMVAPGGTPRLRREETVPGAVFGRLHAWLDANLHRFEFFRPYDRHRGGVAPEPWHLSYAPLAQRFQAAHSLELLERVIRDSELELKDSVLRQLGDIYLRYVLNVAPHVLKEAPPHVA